ncbi:MAG: LytR family transcriptional regulator [Nitriliruptor sp.]|nr:MAG: LytR family transcriptional regulator [Nitriliruptor sp.]
MDPSTVTVQVLDGFQADGGAAAGVVARELEGAGYRIIARNPAVRYDVTTVLWTAGSEDAGRQIAADIGAPAAREQPGNLSTSVMVHVVVGADRG